MLVRRQAIRPKVVKSAIWFFSLCGDSEENVEMLEQRESNAFWDSASQRAVMLPLYQNTHRGALMKCGKDTGQASIETVVTSSWGRKFSGLRLELGR